MQRSVSYVPRWLVLALLVCLFLPVPVTAASDERVGRVMIAMGNVTAEREGVSMRGLGRRDAIHAGDRIRTGPRGRVQIRFQDGGMVDLEANSLFEVEEYSDDDDGGSVVMSFLRGAMRTITGAIGGNSGDSYRMNTPVATLGVRGTAYSLRYCDATCVDGGGEAGLYGRVDDGAVVVDGAAGTGTFGAGQFFLVPDSGSPQRIVAPPEGILDGGDEDAAGDDEDQIATVGIRPLGGGEEENVSLDVNELDPFFESREVTNLLDPDLENLENTDLLDSVSYIGEDTGLLELDLDSEEDTDLLDLLDQD